MKLHANAPLGPKGRLLMVLRALEQGWSLTEAAEAAGVSERTCSKWVARYRAEGEAGLIDRSSEPVSIPHRTPEDRVAMIAALRRLRMTGAEIAFCLGMALSTVSAVLTRIGLGKLSRLDPPEPPNRYERRHAGELLHIDVKKLGQIGDRGAGHRITGSRNRLPAARDRVLPPPRHPRPAGDDRQRIGLSLRDPRARLPRAEGPPPAHPPLPATHQRQGRTVHPNDAARMGLRRHLPKLPTPNRRATNLAHLLQQPTTTQRPWPQDPRQHHRH